MLGKFTAITSTLLYEAHTHTHNIQTIMPNDVSDMDWKCYARKMILFQPSTNSRREHNNDRSHIVLEKQPC